MSKIQKEEQEKASQATISKIQDERNSYWRKFMNALGYTPIPGFFHLLSQVKFGMRYAVGESIKVTEDLLNTQILNWDDPTQRQFRYTYLPLTYQYATLAHFMKERLSQDHALGIKFFSADRSAVMDVMDFAVGETAREIQAGFPWATKNKEEIEKTYINIFDPLWYAGSITAGIKSGLMVGEIKYMTPILEKMYSAKSNGEFIYQAKMLHGADIINPTFYAMVKSIKRHGSSAQDAAKLIYTQGYRAAPWSVDISQFIPYSKYLKRAGNLYSESSADLGDKSATVLNAVKLEWSNAFSRVPKLRKKELETIQMLLHTVPREPYNPTQTFELNYVKMMEDGKVPIVSERIFNITKKAVHELGTGWRGETEAQKLFGDVVDVWKDPSAYKWRSAYGPAAVTVQKVEGEKKLIRAISDAPVSKSWELPREGSYGLFQVVDNFRKWIATVGSRVQRADEINKVVHEARIYKASLDDAIKFAAKQRFGGAAVSDPARLKALKVEYEMVKNLIRDLKEWKDSPDYVKAIKASEPIPVLKAYDFFLNKLRQSQLLLHPSWYWNNLIDSSIIKNFVATGSVDWRGIVRTILKGKPKPVLDAFGKQMEFSQVPSQFLHGASAAPTSTWGRMVKGLGDMMDNIETGAREYLAKTVFDANFSVMVKNGVDIITADARAKVIAAKSADAMHIAYNKQSTMDKIARRLWLYPVFNQRDFVIWTTKMLQYPAESYALMQLRQNQERIGIEGGALKIPGMEFAVDPFRRSSPMRFLDLSLHTDRQLTPQQEPDFRLAKGLSAVMGSWVPPMEYLLTLIGALPRNSLSAASPLEEGFNIVMKGLGQGTYRPSDHVSEVLGYDPKETRNEYDSRRIAFLIAAYKQDGKNISPEHAEELLKRFDAIAWFSNMATSFKLIPAFPGYVKLSQAVKNAREILESSTIDNEDYIRKDIISEPGNEDLHRILPLTKTTRLRYLSGKTFNLEHQTEAEAQYIGVPAKEIDKQERLKNILEILPQSIKLAPFRLLFPTTPAESAENRAALRKLLPSTTEQLRIDNEGNIIYLSKKTGDIKARLAAAEAAADKSRAIEVLFSNDLKTKYGTRMIGEYIDSLADPDGKNFAANLITTFKDNPAIAPYYQQYLRYKTNGAQGVRDNPPIQVNQARTSFSKDYRIWLESGGGNIENRFKMNLADIHKLIDSGAFHLSGGFPKQAFDKDAFDIARANITSGTIFSIKKQYMDGKALEYPGNKFLTDMLKAATYHDPETVNNLVDIANKAIKSGTITFQQGRSLPVDKQFWPDMLNTDLKLYSDISIADRWDHLKGIKTGLFQVDSSGRPFNLDGNYIRELHSRGYEPELSILYSGGDKQFQQMFESAVASIGDGSYKLEDFISKDQFKNSSSFLEDFLYRTGLKSFPTELTDYFAGARPNIPPFTIKQPIGLPTPLLTALPKPIGEQFAIPPASPLPPLLPGPKIDYSTQLPNINNFERLPSVNPDIVQMRRQPINTQYFGSIGRAIGHTNIQWQALNQYNKEHDLPPPSYGRMLGNNFWRTEKIVDPSDPSGQRVIDHKSLSISPTGAAQAISSLIHIGMNLAETRPDSDFARGMAGFDTALSATMALSALGVPPPAAIVIGAGLGITTGLKKPRRFGSADAEHQARVRQEQFEARQREQTRIDELRNIQQREIALTNAFRGGARFDQQRIAPQLARYQRRPTYSSRLGLVEAVERELSGALKPRF